MRQPWYRSVWAFVSTDVNVRIVRSKTTLLKVFMIFMCFLRFVQLSVHSIWGTEDYQDYLYTIVICIQFSIFGLLGTPDVNRNIVTNFSNIQTLTIDC